MKLSTTWQKIIIWLTGYLNIIAFFLGGGYVYLKTESEDARASGKTVLALLLGFTGIEILRSSVYNILSVAGVVYDTLAVISDIASVIAVIKAVVFVTLFLLDLRGIKFTPAKTSDSDKKDGE